MGKCVTSITSPGRAVAPERLLKACGDRTRLRLLRLLSRGEACVCDLYRVLDLPQPTVSRHLAYLRKNGLILMRKAGLWRHYRLAPARDEFHQRLLAALDCCFARTSEANSDRRKLGERGSGACGPGDVNCCE